MIEVLLGTAPPVNSPTSFMDYAESLTVIGLLVAMIVGGLRRWWVFGWSYDELKEDRDQWKQAALKSTDIAEKAVEPSRKRS